MRRHDDVGEPEERARVRLLREDVERGAGDLAALERLDERVLVDQLAAGDVDDPDAVLHPRELLAPDEAARLRRERRVEGDEVRVGDEVVERLGALDPELAEALGRDVRVVGAHAHLEPARAPGDLLADPAEADQPEGLVGELQAGEAASAPTGPP